MEKKLSTGTLVACFMIQRSAHIAVGISVTPNSETLHRVNILELSKDRVINFQQSADHGVYSRDAESHTSVPVEGWIALWKLLKQRAG